MNEEEELKKVTVKDKLDVYKLGNKKIAVGLAIMLFSGVGIPLYGMQTFSDPSIFQTISMVTIPVTGITAAMFAARIKKYLNLKKELDNEEKQEDKGMSL